MVAYTALFSHTRKSKNASKSKILWYPKERVDLKMMHSENNVLTDYELVIVRSLLKESKLVCLYIWNEHPCKFNVLNHA